MNETQQADRSGELVVVENIERRVNVAVGDRQGFRATIQAPVKRTYKGIKKGMVAELLLLSKDPGLERVDKVSDLYLPEVDLWVGDYPYVRRDVFRAMSEEFSERGGRRGGETVRRRSR